MAGEIRFNATLQVVNGPINVVQKKDIRSDQTTAGAVQRRQQISTGGSTLTLTGVTQPRAIIIENLDATNYVELGPDSTGLVGLIRLYPGEVAMLPLKPSVVIKGLADTGNVNVAYTLIET